MNSNQIHINPLGVSFSDRTAIIFAKKRLEEQGQILNLRIVSSIRGGNNVELPLGKVNWYQSDDHFTFLKIKQLRDQMVTATDPWD